MGAMFMSKLTVLLVIVFGFFISVSTAGQHKIIRSTGDSIELSRYELVSRIDVEEVDDDLSGLTFNPLTESLFAVTNEPPQLIEMSLEGRVIRLIPLLGFEDTEGITHVQGNQFALVEERKRQVVFFSVDESTTKIEHEHCEVYALAMKGEKNKGLEGIAWRDGAGLLLAKEDEPEQLYQLAANNQFERGLTVLLQRSETPRSLGDVAGLHSLANGNTLLLSEASAVLLELSPQGEVVSEKSFAGLRYDSFVMFKSIRQPEGVTVADDGRLYIVSEPNQLFIFNKPEVS